MRIIMQLLLSLIPFILAGKETRKVTVEYFYPKCKEIFYVLKSDSSVRHGSYCLLSNKKILIQGYYKNGKRDSIWTQYDMNGILRFKGYFSLDKRDSVCEYFDNEGKLEQKLDFQNNAVLLYRTQFSNQVFRLISGSDTILSLLDRPPLYIGGTSKINEYIASVIESPLHKPNEKVKGTVYIEFLIDSSGVTSNHRVLKGIGTKCNLEAMRVVRLIPDEWLPGVLNNRHVSVFYVIPIIFDEKIPRYNPSILVEDNY
jgi:protein TonB